MVNREIEIIGFDPRSKQTIEMTLRRFKMISPQIYQYFRDHVTRIVEAESDQVHDARIPAKVFTIDVPEVVQEFTMMYNLLGRARFAEQHSRGVPLSLEEMKLDANVFAMQIFESLPKLPAKEQAYINALRVRLEQDIEEESQEIVRIAQSLGRSDFLFHDFEPSFETIVRNAISRLKTYSPRLYEYAKRYVVDIIAVRDPPQEISATKTAYINRSIFESEYPPIQKQFWALWEIIVYACTNEKHQKGLEENFPEAVAFALQVFDDCLPGLSSSDKAYAELLRMHLVRLAK